MYNYYEVKKERRKHTTQLTDQEATLLWEKIERHTDWTWTYHAVQRLLERGLKKEDININQWIANAKIIEYGYLEHTYAPDSEKVLIRTTNTLDKTNQLVLALDITNGKVKSVWANHHKDKHKTLDMSLYDPTLMVKAYEQQNEEKNDRKCIS